MIVGVDVGTQSLKVSVLDERLQFKGGAARSYRPAYPRPGWVEQDPALWERALGPAIAEALSSAGLGPHQVRAIGICGQLDGCIAVDRDGGALSSCLTWMDRRATAEIADIPAHLIRAECGVVLDPSHLAAKARWLKRHLAPPRPIARFHQPVSYLVERLTGQAVIDHALASTSMVYALDRGAYDAALLDRFEISENELPPLAPAEACAGYLTGRGASLTGLPTGLPVAVGTGDDFSMPLGAGLTSPGRVAISVGTGEVVGALHPTPLRDDGGLLETHAYPGGAYYVENPGWLSGGALVWLRDLLGMTDFAAMDELASTAPPGAGGLCFIPALTGAMAPEWRPGARGCFYGLTPAHGRGHLIRALLEGCGFAMRDVVDHMAEIGVAAESILLLGGGAKSRLWAQMRADIAGRPVVVPNWTDTSPIGAALLAAVAGGIAKDLIGAMRAIGAGTTVFEPRPRDREVYEGAYGAYRRLFRSLTPFFENTAATDLPPPRVEIAEHHQMTTDIIAQLIDGTCPDPDGGPPLRVDTRSVVIAQSIAGTEGDLVLALGLGKSLAVVSDKITHGILAARVEQALRGHAKVISVVLPGNPHADDETVAKVRAATAGADALIAVGSGTINDLCKYVSAQDRKPYVVFGTAPSMNGYTSVNAAITVKGHKKSLAAQAPLGVFLDLSILAAAPARMIRSGLGDSLCRPTAQADWLLAHFLFDQPYRTMPFALLAGDEPGLFAAADALMAGDLSAMERLVRTLLLSGFGTAICGNSLPASQGEHLISHYADMLPDSDRPFAFHGEQIGVTTLTSARLQERMLEGPAPVLRPNADGESDFVRRFGPDLGPSCWKEFAQKRLTDDRLDAVNARIAANWRLISATISNIILPSETLRQILQRAGAPTAHADLGWSRGFYAAAVRHAREIRNRYTFLDLAADAGSLDGLIPKLI